jgi:hypothetical protein
VELFQTQKPNDLSAVDFAVQILQSKEQEGINNRITLAKEKITKPEILELLSTLTSTSKTGDGFR